MNGNEEPSREAADQDRDEIIPSRQTLVRRVYAVSSSVSMNFCTFAILAKVAAFYLVAEIRDSQSSRLRMASTLRDELASLKIERPEPKRSSSRHVDADGVSPGRGRAANPLLAPVADSALHHRRRQLRRLPRVRPGPLQGRGERGPGPVDDHGRGREAPERQGLPQVAEAGDDRHQGRRPRRGDAGPGARPGRRRETSWPSSSITTCWP